MRMDLLKGFLRLNHDVSHGFSDFLRFHTQSCCKLRSRKFDNLFSEQMSTDHLR